MSEPNNTLVRTCLPVKATIVMLLFLFIITVFLLSFKKKGYKGSESSVNKDSITSVKAFGSVYKVLMSPRCMNCHPAGDVPLQGNDSHLHTMNVERGKDGHGVYALKCSNCHQSENVPGAHTPPGNPKWALPPSKMKMVFQGKTPHQLALQIMDYKQNGHKDKERLLEHARDTLVKAGWHMGEGRPAPPVSYDAFFAAWDTWIQKGGYAPK